MYLKLLSLCTTALILVSCEKTSSQLDGHYENADAQSMAIFKGQQTAIAEYLPSRSVVISLTLIQMGKEEIAAGILSTDIEALWVMVPNNYTEAEANKDFEELRQRGGDLSRIKLVRQDSNTAQTVWARDWAPLGAFSASGELRMLDFNYYINRPFDDSAPQSIADAFGFKRLSIPVYNEGGNFMNTAQGHCMITSRATDANSRSASTHPEDMVLSDAEIEAYYKDYAGCKKVTIFPRMPYEGTGHIDMWAKIMSDGVVLVNELRDEVINHSYYSEQDRIEVREIQSYLNERAKEIQSMGYMVVRIPMPGPVFVRYEGGDVGRTFRSYSNSLLLNGKILMPRYESMAFDQGSYFDESLRAKYEEEVQGVHEELGFQFEWINADDLIAIGGAVHCSTMQIPR